MKLNDIRPTLETSGGMEEEFFSIQDQGMIFDILRNKMYSNPILAICREITSNARDAHREVKKADQPIQISIPSSFDPFYKIKDWGPGISPDRMLNIFIKYTASTKRADNEQTGGFGLGAKTPFSYSDSFTIETVVDGQKYLYSCVIDPTKVGKLVPLGQEPCDEPNSTEIAIPVKPTDFKFFKDGSEFVTRHWDVKPIIRGDKFTYQPLTFSLNGTGWAIAKNDANNYHYNKRDMKLVIDGIEYPVDINQLKGYANTALLDAINGTIYLYFGVGELALSASREAIHLDKPTQDKIGAKLQLIAKDLTDNVQQKIQSYKDLWEANMYLTTELVKSFANLAFLGKLEWQGIELHRDYVNTDLNIYDFYKGKYHRKSTDPNKLSRSMSHHVAFKPHTTIYFNDLGIKDPTVKHVSVAFTNDATLQSLQVICLPDKMTWDDLNKKYHFDKMGAKKLSDITKVSRTYKVAGVRLLVFKFDPASMAFKQEAIKSMEEDTNAKVICTLDRDDYNGTRRAVLSGKRYVGGDTIKSLIDGSTDVSFYGVDDSIPQDKIDENFEDFTPLDKYIDEKVFENKTIDYMELKYIERNQYSLSRDHLKFIQKYSTLITDNNSLYLNNLKLQQALKEIWAKNSGLLKIYESVKGVITDADVAKWLSDNPNKDLKRTKEKVDKTYPLVIHVDFHYHDRLIEPLIHYINLVDKDINSI